MAVQLCSFKLLYVVLRSRQVFLIRGKGQLIETVVWVKQLFGRTDTYMYALVLATLLGMTVKKKDYLLHANRLQTSNCVPNRVKIGEKVHKIMIVKAI